MDETAEITAAPEERTRRWMARRSQRGGAANGQGAVYGLGLIGAAVYFFQSAESGWDYVLAFPRAAVWPALLVYKLLKRLYG
jgi:hypothetical protein